MLRRRASLCTISTWLLVLAGAGPAVAAAPPGAVAARRLAEDAVTLFLQGKWEAAAAQFDRAVKLDGASDPTYERNAARAWQFSLRTERARAGWAAYLTRRDLTAPDRAEAQNHLAALAHYEAGSVAQAAEDWTTAREKYTQALAEVPDWQPVRQLAALMAAKRRPLPAPVVAGNDRATETAARRSGDLSTKHGEAEPRKARPEAEKPPPAPVTRTLSPTEAPAGDCKACTVTWMLGAVAAGAGAVMVLLSAQYARSLDSNLAVTDADGRISGISRDEAVRTLATANTLNVAGGTTLVVGVGAVVVGAVLANRGASTASLHLDAIDGGSLLSWSGPW